MTAQFIGAHVDATRALLHLLDNLPLLITFWDADQRLVGANRVYCDWLGVDPAEVAGIHLRDAVGEERYLQLLPVIERVLAGETQQVDRATTDASGLPRSTRATFSPQVAHGTVVGFSAIAEDTSVVSALERQLEETQALTSTGSWTYLPLTGCVEWSPQMYRLIECEPTDGEPSLEFWKRWIHPDDREETVASLADCFDHGKPFDLHSRLLLPSGRVRHIRCLGKPTFDADGQYTRMTGTVQDHTDMQEAQQQLERINQQLDRSNRRLSDLLATLGHDVRQPVQSAMGFLEFTLAEWKYLSDEERYENVSRALRAGGRIMNLFEEILTMMNLESGELVTRPATIRLGEVIRQIADEHSEDLSIHIENEVAAHVDLVHLSLILRNLIANALRYGEPPIGIEVVGNSEHVRIAVSDLGQGVPAGFEDRLFERFTRAESGVAAQQDGTGFGLYLARKLARANDGDLTYRPNRPAGSRFELTLPAGGH